MVTGIFSSGLSAYKTAQQLQGVGGIGNIGGTQATDGKNFSDILADAAQDSVEVLKEGERATIAGAKGTADITNVVTAVNNAELTLQTIVAVRDKVINAYQDIMRMPI